MKKNKSFIAALMLGTIVMLSSCSKYDENPMLAIGSKTGRLTGEWKLSEMKSVETESNGSETTTYDGSMMTTIVIDNGTSATSTYAYSETITIVKDGTYTTKYTSGTMSGEMTEYWSWVDGASSKERILLNGTVYDIVKLTGKELVLAQNSSSTMSFGTSTSISKEETTITYTKE